MRFIRLVRTGIGCAVAAAVAVPGVVALPSVATEAATPSVGGVLNVLGWSDVDYLDPNVTYYSLGYSAVREFSRQLYSFPATSGHTTDTMPDLATDLPQISSDGRTYRITIRPGAMWGTNPARQVTAADAVRGVEVTCNPSQPFGGLPSYVNLIAGFRTFCRDFAGVNPTAAAIKRFLNRHSVSGLHPAANDPLTVVFRLNHRADYFTDMLTLPAFSPRPVEMLAYVPGTT